MPTSCIALGCNERSNKKSDPSITFHRLPKDPSRREKWILALQRDNYTPGKKAWLCSTHFAPEDFDGSTLSYVRIRKDAVPSIFSAFPAHPKTDKRKTPNPLNLCEDTEIAEFNRKDSDKEKSLDHVQENNSVLGLEHEFDMESQHDNEPTLKLEPEGDIVYIKEEMEDEYYEMGYEGAPVLNADVKSEFGNGYDGRGETEKGDIEIKEEAIELKEEPSEMQEKRGEKRPVQSPPSFSNSKKQRTEVADECEDTVWVVKFNPKEEPSSVEKDSDSGHEQHDAEETEDEYDGTKDAAAESAAPPVPADEILAEIPDIHDDDDLPDVRERSRSPTPPPPHGRSRESSVSSNVSIPVSISSVVPDDKGKKKKKRAKKNPCKLSVDEEELMLDFIRDNPMIWNTKMMDYKRKDKKDKIWEDQAEVMDKTTETLKGWFKSLRDTYTRFDKKKSSDGAPDLTEREQWIMSKFAFLKTITRHRPEPFQSVKATIQQHRGDLDAAETACADMEINTDEMDPTPSFTPSSSRKRPQDQNSAVLESLQKRVAESLQKRVAESGTILKNLSTAQQQPITARTTFANYVRDSLLTMSNAKYKKARSTMNRLLYDLIDEDSDNDIPSAMGAPSIPASQPFSTTTASQFNTGLISTINHRAVSATSPPVEKRASTIISV